MKDSFTAVLMLDTLTLATRENVTPGEFEMLVADAPIGTKWVIAN